MGAKRPTDSDIEEQANMAQESTRNLSGMTYQEGVANALLWVLGQYDDTPMEKE